MVQKYCWVVYVHAPPNLPSLLIRVNSIKIPFHSKFIKKQYNKTNFSRRIWYPTLSLPTISARSSATRWATEMALILRGCVHRILHTEAFSFIIASSKMNCATWVVLPQPVNPLNNQQFMVYHQSSPRVVWYKNTSVSKNYFLGGHNIRKTKLLFTGLLFEIKNISLRENDKFSRWYFGIFIYLRTNVAVPSHT